MPRNLFFRSLLIPGFLLILLACSGDEKPPGDLIPQDKMAKILADIHVAEAQVTNMQLRSLDSSVMVYGELQKKIWKKYKVDTLLYRKSYSFYTSHPAYLTEIYDQVEKNLEIREKKKQIKL
ncbi:DUF4296 domain-containing protein [Salmonirosea aquatica]|uniref:DUF4296 domain-containing protein n=1 Tax=Salmonirosea aquatica TaxID=2654236 RepID=A0A7C9FS58_9BACT|nr:DUF4296 domain-containing protein [Cytophagaceae bacterium SJW1-29]